MADVKISELTANTTPAAADVVAVSNAAATATTKVTLQKVAQMLSDSTGISGATEITNIIKISNTDYQALVTAGTTSATTVYIIE